MEDEVTPGYFRMIREGLPLPVNYMSQTRSRWVEAEVGSETTWFLTSARNSCDPSKISRTATFEGNLPLSQKYKGSLATLAIQTTAPSGLATVGQLAPEALAEARLKDQDVLTSIAEIGKTVDLLKGAHTRVLSRAHRITRALRRKGKMDAIIPRSASHAAAVHRLRTTADARARNSFLDAFYDTWMEDRYGFRILGFEIESAIETWEKLKLGVGPVVKGGAEHSVESITSSTSQLVAGIKASGAAASYPSHYYSTVRKIQATRKVGLGYRYAINTMLTVDPVVTGLELLKFSFIADWFTNLGDIIRAYSPFGMGSVLWFWTSVEIVHREDCTLVGALTSNQWALVCPTPVGRTMAYGATYKTRSPVSWNDHKPELRFFIDLDIPKVIDLMAILRGFGAPLRPWMRV